jgi:hypothetical protein
MAVAIDSFVGIDETGHDTEPDLPLLAVAP